MAVLATDIGNRSVSLNTVSHYFNTNSDYCFNITRWLGSI